MAPRSRPRTLPFGVLILALCFTAAGCHSPPPPECPCKKKPREAEPPSGEAQEESPGSAASPAPRRVASSMAPGSEAAPHATAQATAPATADEGDGAEEDTPRILRFDCTKADDVPAPPSCATADVPSDVGLRTFELGGPEGSAWNAYYLDCAVRVSTPCEANADLDVFVGNRRVHRAKPIASAEQTCRFGLIYKEWEVELDPPRDLLYDTVVFRAELRQACGEEPAYLKRTDDSFVAGFAEGE